MVFKNLSSKGIDPQELSSSISAAFQHHFVQKYIFLLHPTKKEAEDMLPLLSIQ
jgi:hypothetical protein